MKNKVILALLLALCFIPSVVAVASYNSTKNAPVDESTANSISIDDVNGKNYTLYKTRDGDEADVIIQYFLSLPSKAQSIVALPDSLMGQHFFKVEISSPVRKQVAEYYFTTDPDTCYYRTSEGAAYKLDPTDAEVFITSKYAESLYEEAALPKLTLSGAYDIQPDSAIWQYKNYTGEFVDADVSEQVFEHVESYELEGGLDLSFDLLPDLCTVKITGSDDNVYFDGNLEDVGTFNLSSTEQLNVEVSARWYEDYTRSFCGELEYNFTSLVSAPAEFYIAMPVIDAGKFTAVTALNVTNPANVRLSTTMEDEPDMTFYKYDDTTAVGFLPIPFDTPEGVYTLTFVYGGTTQDITITVESEGEKRSDVSVGDAILAYRTEDSLSQFETVAATLATSGSTTKYFSGSWGTGVPDGSTLMRGFGRDIYVNGDATPLYRNNGVDYQASAGLDVTACNGGEVVYASSECTYAGNMVVIEHGFGLKTWYYNLGSIDVAVGDVVEKGEKIGTTGQTGFGLQVGAHVAMSVGSTFVSPYDTWANSENHGKVAIAKIDE